MTPGAISHATRKFGAPSDMPDCQPLLIRDVEMHGQAAMASAWYPTPEEVLAITEGAPIYLFVYGTQHPPVWLTVGENPL